MLSGRTSPGDKIGALDVGADDYVTKPFAMAELLARLRAVLRRDDGEADAGPARAGVSPGHDRPVAGRPDRAPGPGAAGTGGREQDDAPAHADRVADPGDPAPPAGPAGRVGADADRGVGPGFQQRTNYLRFHMARLRRKLEDNPARPRHLLTEPGMGYRYQP